MMRVHLTLPSVEEGDKDRIKSDIARANNIGEIEIEVSTCSVIGTTHSPKPSREQSVDLTFEEKSLKGEAKSHGAQ